MLLELTAQTEFSVEHLGGLTIRADVVHDPFGHFRIRVFVGVLLSDEWFLYIVIIVVG